MELVRTESVQSRYCTGLPRTLEFRCPNCRERALFHVRPWQEHGLRVTAAEAPCERCEAPVQLVQLVEDGGRPRLDALYASPGPGERRPMAGREYLAARSEPLARTYDTVIDLLNQGQWGAAALTARHLVEGLVPTFAPKEARDAPLARQLQVLAGDADTTRPLRNSAKLLGPDGPFEQQFRDVAGIGRDAAERLLDVVEQMIDVLVVRPAASDDLCQRIDSAPVRLPVRRVERVKQQAAVA